VNLNALHPAENTLVQKTQKYAQEQKQFPS
jgi:hypothetical protein